MSNEMKNNGDERNGKPDFTSGSAWFPVILIVLGVIFLAQRLGGYDFDNWWALFILIPALSALGGAVSMWQRDRRFHIGVWSTLSGGFFPLLVAVMFLFDVDWGDYWPLFIILGGLSTMVSGLPFPRPDDVKVPSALLKHRPWPFFIGASAALLGFSFLGLNLGIFDTVPFIPFENWWGVFILIPALGGLLTSVLLLMGRHSMVLVLVNFGAGLIVGLAGVIAIFNLDWELMNYTTPVLLILAGIGLLVGFKDKSDTGDSVIE